MTGLGIAAASLLLYLALGARQEHWPFIMVTSMVGTAAFIGLIAGVAMHFYARAADRLLAEFDAGRFIARWTIDPLAGRRHAAAEGTRLRKAGALVGIMLGLGLALGLAGADIRGALSWKAGPALRLLLVVGVGIGAAVITWFIMLVAADARESRRRRGGEVYIGRDGVYCLGDVCVWNTQARELAGAELTRRDGAVCVRLVISTFGGTAGKVANASMALAGRPGVAGQEQEMYLPVPEGTEAEAGAAVRALLGLDVAPDGDGGPAAGSPVDRSARGG